MSELTVPQFKIKNVLEHVYMYIDWFFILNSLLNYNNFISKPLRGTKTVLALIGPMIDLALMGHNGLKNLTLIGHTN